MLLSISLVLGYLIQYGILELFVDIALLVYDVIDTILTVVLIIQTCGDSLNTVLVLMLYFVTVSMLMFLVFAIGSIFLLGPFVVIMIGLILDALINQLTQNYIEELC